MTTRTLPDEHATLRTSEPTYSHIVGPRGGKEGHVLAMEARLHGTSVTGLCGHTFIPSRDVRSVPPCGRCEDLFRCMYPDGEPSES